MKTITLKLTNSELNILNSCAEKNLISTDIVSTNGRHILTDTPTYIHDVDKFREFLNDEILSSEFHKITNPRKYYLMKADNVLYKSILNKLN